LLAYITYFIVTIIIRFVQRASNLAAAACRQASCGARWPAAGTLYKTYKKCKCLCTGKPARLMYVHETHTLLIGRVRVALTPFNRRTLLRCVYWC